MLPILRRSTDRRRTRWLALIVLAIPALLGAALFWPQNDAQVAQAKSNYLTNFVNTYPRSPARSLIPATFVIPAFRNETPSARITAPMAITSKPSSFLIPTAMAITTWKKSKHSRFQAILVVILGQLRPAHLLRRPHRHVGPHLQRANISSSGGMTWACIA